MAAHITPREVALSDVLVFGQGSIVLFQPRTKASLNWLRQNTDGLWYGGSLAVEPRYASALFEGLLEAGLTAEVS